MRNQPALTACLITLKETKKYPLTLKQTKGCETSVSHDAYANTEYQQTWGDVDEMGQSKPMSHWKDDRKLLHLLSKHPMTSQVGSLPREAVEGKEGRIKTHPATAGTWNECKTENLSDAASGAQSTFLFEEMSHPLQIWPAPDSARRSEKDDHGVAVHSGIKSPLWVSEKRSTFLPPVSVLPSSTVLDVDGAGAAGITGHDEPVAVQSAHATSARCLPAVLPDTVARDSSKPPQMIATTESHNLPIRMNEGVSMSPGEHMQAGITLDSCSILEDSILLNDQDATETIISKASGGNIEDYTKTTIPEASGGDMEDYTKTAIHEASGGDIEDDTKTAIRKASGGDIEDDTKTAIRKASGGDIEDDTKTAIHKAPGGDIEDYTKTAIREASGGDIEDYTKTAIPEASGGNIEDYTKTAIREASGGDIEDYAKTAIPEASGGNMEDYIKTTIPEASGGDIEDYTKTAIPEASGGDMEDYRKTTTPEASGGDMEDYLKTTIPEAFGGNTEDYIKTTIPEASGGDIEDYTKTAIPEVSGGDIEDYTKTVILNTSGGDIDDYTKTEMPEEPSSGFGYYTQVRMHEESGGHIEDCPKGWNV